MAGSLERWVATQILRAAGDPPVSFELADGETVASATVRRALEEPAADALGNPSERRCGPKAVIRLHDHRAVFALLYKPTRSFGNLYAAGRLSTNIDLAELLELLYPALHQHEHERSRATQMFSRVLDRRPRHNSLGRSRSNVHAHYDIGNDFYQLWLDRDHQQYTCAYYPNDNITLEQAQAAKLELVSRKLALKPGETVVEAGSGWGGLACYMAKNHGVRVRSYNISTEQIAFARKRAKSEGLESQVEFIEDDFRNISGSYDAFVSVGMLEHVGRSSYRVLGSVIDACLKPNGRGLIHTIGQNDQRPLNEWIERNIFPGAYPPTLREMMEIFEPVGLSVVDVENLRPHYARTLQDWRDRFDNNIDKVTDMFDERFVRTWSLYLAGSKASFSNGRLQLFQVLFNRPGGRALPITREHLYTSG